MALSLKDIAGRHEGETIWVIGTGPSLARVNLEAITGPRICLNRVMFATKIIRNATYWMFVDDPWAKEVPGPWKEYLMNTFRGVGITAVMRKKLMTGKGFSKAPDGPNVVHFDYWNRNDAEKSGDIRTHDRQAVIDSNMLYCYTGTAAPAVHLAWVLGASKVKLVGIDGTDGHGPQVAHWYATPMRGGFAYAKSRQEAIDTASMLGMEVEDLSTEQEDAIV